jgi:NADH-quinone oxidoreductase subunit F
METGKAAIGLQVRSAAENASMASEGEVRRLSKSGQLEALRQAIRSRSSLNDVVVRICATGCRAFGALDVLSAFKDEIHKRSLGRMVEVRATGCQRLCARAPVVSVDPAGIMYFGVTAGDVDEVVSQTLVRGKIVERLCLRDPRSGEVVSEKHQIPFFGQEDIVLGNCGIVDPTDINQYIQRNGYGALETVVETLTPEMVIDAVKRSGLRGRGGAGFPTGLKWELTRQAKGHPKFVICNADEGDPGAFMDRAVLEGDPHTVLEGMIIAGYAMGAARGFIYVRAEYPIAVQHLGRAIAQARQLGILGDDILGSPFSFDVEIKEGAGAFVCGEETALIASIEGRRGMPRPRPPYPGQSGLGDQPTCINNVETLANIRHVILLGSEEFARIGSHRSRGTKVFSLAGKVANTGLVEVPLGITIRKMIFDIGGGIVRGRKLKAVQMGGPSGGCVPEKYLDLPVDYESLQSIGSIMGSGGVIVMDERTCMVELARYFLSFTCSESCGKCAPCRLGTKQMLELLGRITKGEGREGDVEKLEHLARVVSATALCGLGQNAPKPVLSTIQYFRNEYEAHIRSKKCDAGICESLMVSPCQHTCPVGVDVPRYIEAIARGRHAEAAEIIRERNPFPAVCGRICHHPCESRCRRGDLEDPVAIRALKRFAADWYFSHPEAPPEPFPITKSERVAVIGGGPSGLSCAYHLRRMGYGTTVIEALGVAGGMLMVGVPQFRLPAEVVQREVEYIARRGVEIRTNCPISANYTLEDLKREGFRAVFISAGAQKSQRIGVPGEEEALEGIFYGLNFLREVKLRRPPPLGDRIVVIGGGNVAVDVARSARRLKLSSQVSIVCLESRGEMPAFENEVEEALEENIGLHAGLGVKRIIGRNGKVREIETIKVDRVFDETGRFNPSFLPGTEDSIRADTVVFAVGQAPDLSFLPAGSSLERTRWETLVVDGDTLSTNVPWIFAGGDFVSGPANVIVAIAAGRRAALSIDMFLRGKKGRPPVWDLRPERRECEGGPLEPLEVPRVQVRYLDGSSRVRGFDEAEVVLSEEEAMIEARRCLRCDLTGR